MEDKTKIKANGEQDTQMSETEMLERIRLLISKDKFNDLESTIENFPISAKEKNEIALILRKYKAAKNDDLEGIISKQEFDIAINQTGKKLLNYFLVKSISNSKQQEKELNNLIKINKKQFAIAITISAIAILGALMTLKILFKKDHVALIGSGSVYNFLLEKPKDKLFDNSSLYNLIKYQLNISPIESRSNSAKNVISASYQRGEPQDKEKNLLGIIGMSSSPIDSIDKDTSNKYFSLLIGIDPLEVVIGASKKELLPPSSENISIDDLTKFVKDTSKYQVYITDSGSGTLESYDFLKSILDTNNTKRFNPYEKPYKINEKDNFTIESLKQENKIWITLGSHYYTLTDAEKKQFHGLHRVFKVADKYKDLFLYFKIDNPIIKDLTSDKKSFKGYELDKTKSLFLDRFFGKLGEWENENDYQTLKLLDNGNWGIRDTLKKDRKEYGNVIKDFYSPKKENKFNYGISFEQMIFFVIIVIFCLVIYFIKVHNRK